MQLNELRQKTKRETKKRVGRSGSRGKTSGRGHKGQKARAGHRIRPEIRDAIKKLPKRRGYGKNRARTVNDSVIRNTPVNLGALEESFQEGERVTPETLFQKGLISLGKGKISKVKILGGGAVAKKLLVSGCSLSQTAREAILRAGGSVE